MPRECGQPEGDPEGVAQGLGPVLAYTVSNDLNEDTKGRLT